MAKLYWYHSMPVPGTSLVTPGHAVGLKSQWDWSMGKLSEYHRDKLITGGPSLDIGCRDGMFSFWLEDNGMGPVTAIDNNVTGGIRWMNAQRGGSLSVKEVSVYNFKPEQPFKTVLFFGVLYHLRYPFNGIRSAVESTAVGGSIVIETGILKSNEIPLLYCPVKSSPWDSTSCSFFNGKALSETMESFGCKMISKLELYGLTGNVDRGIAVYRKQVDFHLPYWEGIHRDYSDQKKSRSSEMLRSL